MIIGIEAQRIFRKKKFGIDRVGIALIKSLQSIDKENQYFVFVNSGPDFIAISETSNFKIVILPSISYPIWEQILLPKAVKKYKCDILHCTSGTAPFFCDIPILLTLHDIIFLERNMMSILFRFGNYYNKLGNIYRKIITHLIINKCSLITTVSNFEKKQIVQFFPKINPLKIKVIHNGVNHFFSQKDDEESFNRTKKKYRLPDLFFLFTGGNDYRKNIKNTLKAFALFMEKNNQNIKIVLLHHKMSEIKYLLKKTNNDKLIENIVLIDYVSDLEMRILYKLSIAFLYTSKREGFGIPILEAMMCGTPVITSNSSSMPEISENSTHLINPNDFEDISNAMCSIYNNVTYRESLIKKGIKRSFYFSWEKMAQQFLNTYQNIWKSV
ncbi:glycosyltransferase family 4 protein [Tenacibaculum sp. nBUS_03]|uniref:glycosyltransferase family 4 protein n=1 Tax=Tenacibaculum sp. nBUS_03 TaxID=3395320 RepID=UPI003EBE2F6C